MPGPPNFDRVARPYRWAEYFLLGPLLQRCREQFLPQILHAEQALVLGDGDGRFLAKLLRRSPTIRALAVDLSALMLHLLQERCAFAGHRLSTLQASVAELPPAAVPHGTGLVVTHFLLDCLTQDQVDHLSRMLAAHVAPGCLWILSEFGLPAKQPWRALAAAYIQGLYLAFRILTGLRTRQLPDIHASLQAAGWRLQARVIRCKGLLYSELWQLAAKPDPAVSAQLHPEAAHPPTRDP